MGLIVVPRVPSRQAVGPAIALDQSAQALRHGEDDVAVADVKEHVIRHPLGEDGRALGLAGG
jgi:hypothetical protein